ncbi:MAG: thioredoxin family protein [Caldilineaceae bacterium]|nr:thioredoxin family protein [Caldilineaceae bacterium]MCB9162772.1 thioredoxin family protein [Caldilineaceae bacterium]
MALLNDQIRDQVRNEFDALTGEVKLVLFTQKMECQYCSETRELAEELAGLTDKIAIEIFDFEDDKEAVETYNIDKIPAMAIVKGGDEPQDYGIRLYGIPSGYEFSTLLEDILMVSSGDSGLSDQTKTELAELTTPLHLQVFVTPTCPYCPRAVRLAHMMAMESHLVTGDMVEAIEFPHLSNKYNVMGVPRTVINEHAYLEGAAPEAMLMAKVREAIAA